MSTYNPDKPAYQTNGLMPDFLVRTHPGMNQVIIPAPDAVDQIRAVELQRGADMMWWGMWVAIACAFLHGMIKSSFPALKPFSKFLEWGIVGGVLAIVGGMLYKNIVEYEKIILLGVSVCGVGGLLYWKRDWSASHLFKKKQPIKEIVP